MSEELVSFHWPKLLPKSGYPTRVGRWAVLNRLRRSPDDESKLRASTHSIVNEWRQRLADLDGYGEKLPGSERSKHFMLNCPPMFIEGVRPATRPCGRSTICPHCWARWAGYEVWRNAERAFFPDLVADRSGSSHRHASSPPEPGGARSPRPVASVSRVGQMAVDVAPTPSAIRSRFTLLERTMTLPGRGLWTHAPETRISQPTLPSFFALRIKGRKSDRFGRAYDFRACRAAGVLGGFEHMTVALRRPSPRGQPDGWIVTVRQIFALPADLDPESIKFVVPTPIGDGIPQGSFASEVIATPTRRDVAAAVSRACPYPTLLMNAPVNLAHDFLSARRGFRLSASFGSFRHQHARRTIDAEVPQTAATSPYGAAAQAPPDNHLNRASAATSAWLRAERGRTHADAMAMLLRYVEIVHARNAGFRTLLSDSVHPGDLIESGMASAFIGKTSGEHWDDDLRLHALCDYVEIFERTGDDPTVPGLTAFLGQYPAHITPEAVQVPVDDTEGEWAEETRALEYPKEARTDDGHADANVERIDHEPTADVVVGFDSEQLELIETMIERTTYDPALPQFTSIVGSFAMYGEFTVLIALMNGGDDEARVVPPYIDLWVTDSSGNVVVQHEPIREVLPLFVRLAIKETNQRILVQLVEDEGANGNWLNRV